MSESKCLSAAGVKPDPATFLEQNCKHVEQDHSFLIDHWLHKRWSADDKFSGREMVSVDFPDW